MRVLAIRLVALTDLMIEANTSIMITTSAGDRYIFKNEQAAPRIRLTGTMQVDMKRDVPFPKIKRTSLRKGQELLIEVDVQPEPPREMIQLIDPDDLDEFYRQVIAVNI